MTQQEAVKELVDYAVALNTTAESQREIEAIQCCLAKSVEVIMNLRNGEFRCSTEHYFSCKHWKENPDGCRFCTKQYLHSIVIKN